MNNQFMATLNTSVMETLSIARLLNSKSGNFVMTCSISHQFSFKPKRVNTTKYRKQLKGRSKNWTSQYHLSTSSRIFISLAIRESPSSWSRAIWPWESVEATTPLRNMFLKTKEIGRWLCCRIWWNPRSHLNGAVNPSWTMRRFQLLLPVTIPIQWIKVQSSTTDQPLRTLKHEEAANTKVRKPETLWAVPAKETSLPALIDHQKEDKAPSLSLMLNLPHQPEEDLAPPAQANTWNPQHREIEGKILWRSTMWNKGTTRPSRDTTCLWTRSLLKLRPFYITMKKQRNGWLPTMTSWERKSSDRSRWTRAAKPRPSVTLRRESRLWLLTTAPWPGKRFKSWKRFSNSTTELISSASERLKSMMWSRLATPWIRRLGKDSTTGSETRPWCLQFCLAWLNIDN